jgi:hypothetical protein
MTIIGLTILNAFYKILASPYVSARRCYVTNREAAILGCIFNFEESTFATPQMLEAEFGLTAERIRQLYRRALRKIARRATRGIAESPAAIIRQVIDSKLTLPKRNAVEAIALIIKEDLSDFPNHIVFDLLSSIYYANKFERKEAKASFQTALREERRVTNDVKRLEILTEKKARQFETILETVVWFGNVSTWKREAFERQKPKRGVNQNDFFYSGIFRSYKCNRDVQYESKQELYFIKLLEMSPQVEYYLEQPVTISYHRNGKNRTYTPDFAILLNTGQCVLAEIKELSDMAFSVVHRRMEALIEYCETHGFGFLLTNGKYSIDRLMTYTHNSRFEFALRERLYEPGAGTLYYGEYRDILEKYNGTFKDLLAIVIKNGWAFYPSVFNGVFRLNHKNPYLVFRMKIIDYLCKRCKMPLDITC